MKTILACLDPNNFYRLEVSDGKLNEIVLAREWLDNCPFDGELRLHTPIYHINTNNWLTCDIAIYDDLVGVDIFTWKREDLLECDNLLELPDLWLTRRFRLMLDQAEKHLSPSDIELVYTWQQLHPKILEKFNQT